MTKDQYIFFDNLRAGRLLKFAFSWLTRSSSGATLYHLCAIHKVSLSARMLAILMRGFGYRIKVKELDFDFIDDVRLPGISSPIEYCYFTAFPAFVNYIQSRPEYTSALHHFAKTASHLPYIEAYIAKRLMYEVRNSIQGAFTAVWYNGRLQAGEPTILFLERSWWFDFLSEHVAPWGIRLHAFPERAGDVRRIVYYLGRRLRSLYFRMTSSFFRRDIQEALFPKSSSTLRIAAESYLNGIRREILFNTEFFWYRQPSLPEGTVFAYFALPSDQPTKSRQVWLKAARVGWIDRPNLHRIMDSSPIQDYHKRAGVFLRDIIKVFRSACSGAPDAISAYIVDFYRQYEQWCFFFRATGTRIHVSSYDVFAPSEALHAALADSGGVSISIQRSIEHQPFLLRRTVTDVHFAFSTAQAELERLSGSTIEQYIASGYLFDNAFTEARVHAQQLSSRLRGRGVTFILCFFDQNTGIDRKRIGGRRLTQEDYTFLCDRLEADKSLGLILKPKRPDTLPQRLGPVWKRVKELIDSGRCILLAGESLDERLLPCVAASASDLAIGLLSGGTSGLESYLAGTTTLMLRHGVYLGPFTNLPKGCVVFEKWEELWNAVERYRADPSDPDIGNWEPIIEQLASPRDGHASERAGNYIFWLYKAFEMGKSREEALKYAAALYAATWGSDLIVRIHQSAAGDGNFCQEKPLSNEETVQSFSEVNR